jgi:hypothetical protein
LKQGTAQELAEDEMVRKVYLGQNFELKKKVTENREQKTDNREQKSEVGQRGKQQSNF